MNKKLIAVIFTGIVLVGCSSNAQKETMDINRQIIAAQIATANKPLIDMTCPEKGCNFKSFVVANPLGASSLRTIATPKGSGEKVLDGVLQFLPIAGQLWLQDRNGQRGLESQRINADLTQGIISGTMSGAGNLVEQALGAVPETVVVNPEVIQPTVQVIDQPTIQEPFVLERDYIENTTTTTTNTTTSGTP